MAREIELTQGKVAVVDDADYEWISQWKWNVSTDGYAKRNNRSGDRPKTVLMHRQIMDAPSGMEVDHINHNKLDNRRRNLRVCNRSQNGKNRLMNRDNVSGYKGVSWCKSRKKWYATIKYKGRQKNLGRYDNKKEAAEAYREAAEKLFGDFMGELA